MGFCVSWRVLSGSEVGTSHIQTGRACEDSCWAQVLKTPEDQPFLAVFVADGAGSAARGGQGAELAMSAAASFIEKRLKQPELGLGDELAVACVQAVRTAIDSAATAAALKPRDFACTFLGLLSFERGSLLMQVGDGGIVVDFGQGLEVPIEPMGGEYANMTCFVTGDDAIQVLQTQTFDQPVLRAAIFSDGLQRLALNMSTNTAHVPFFKPLFTVLSQSTEEQEDQLAAALKRFLSSEAVNERTDDDKTLAMAVLPINELPNDLVSTPIAAVSATVKEEKFPLEVEPESVDSTECGVSGVAQTSDISTPDAPADQSVVDALNQHTRQRRAAAVYAKNSEG
jgi:hypothetical protein